MFAFAILLQSTYGADRTPGFSYLGQGYDILKGNPLSTTGLGDPGHRVDIFDFTFDEGLTTNDGRYLVADLTDVDVFQSCSSEVSVDVFNSLFSYQSLQKSSFSGNVKYGPASLSFGVDSKNIRQKTLNQQEIYAHASAVCTAYKLSMFTGHQAPVKSNFQRFVENLPVEYDQQAYMTMIAEFGTHYINQMKVGGRWGHQMTFKTSDYQALEDNQINFNVGLKAAVKDANKAGGGLDLSGTNQRTTAYNITRAVTSQRTFNTGGEYREDAREWMETVKDAPFPVHMTLTPLDMLFTPDHLPLEVDLDALEAKRANFIRATEEYCSYTNELERANEALRGAAPAPAPLHLGGTNDPHARNLEACVGECDGDWQCKSGLKCFQRSGFTPVPGCLGEGKEDWDYCYDPSGSRELGGENDDDATNLGACTGECDGDWQCAPGLKCFQRENGETIPGCKGSGSGEDWDYCYNPNWTAGALPRLGGTNDAHARNLEACVGECDGDWQCKSGLKCFQRSGFTPVPGCAGEGKEDWDYCYDPSGSIELGGGNDGDATNLEACTGECDGDWQCAPGLKCFQREDGETIPGCKGSGSGEDWDYCYNPNWTAAVPAVADEDICTAPPREIPFPKPSPVAERAVRRICVANRGGYAMFWHLLRNGQQGSRQGSYPNPQTRCIDANIDQPVRGDHLSCRVKAIAGRTVNCEDAGVTFDARSQKQANYVCRGTTLSIKCTFDGISGLSGNNGR